ncbi:MAG: hypothetical protein AB1472_03360 [Candidatus Omnitrophota bacterium]
MKNKILFLIVVFVFIISTQIFAQDIKAKLEHLYITITKIEISQDSGNSWIKASEGNQVQDLVAISGQNVIVFQPATAKIKEGIYNRARTTIDYVKLEMILDDGIHGQKKIVLEEPGFFSDTKKYPFIDEREIRVNVKDRKSLLQKGTFKFDAQNSYTIKAIWDNKTNDYKITDMKFDPAITIN